MKFGTLQIVLGDGLDTVFASAARLGFHGVELDWMRREDAETGPFAPENRASIVADAVAAGVEICSVCAHFLNGGNLAGPGEPAEAAAAIALGIELCVDLGAPVLLVPFFGSAEITDAAEAQLIQYLRPLARRAEAAGVRLGIETARPGAAMARVFEAVGSKAVGSYWDMANGLSLGYAAEEELAQLAPHLVQVHAKEWSGPEVATGPGQYPGLNQVPFGQGDVPAATILATLWRAGYDGYIVLETGAFGDYHGSAAAALQHLRTLTAEANV